MTTSVIIAGARTPIGRLLGSLSGLSASDLGGIAIREALSRAGVAPSDVDAVIMGNVVQAGVGPNPARRAAIAGGIGFEVPSITLNKLCLSGLSAIAHADQLIRLGEHEIIVAGGFESMTNAPHMLLGSRKGTKYGAARMVDALDQDALTCAFDGISMGAATERYQASYGLTREAQDEFANASHARASQAATEGRRALRGNREREQAPCRRRRLLYRVKRTSRLGRDGVVFDIDCPHAIETGETDDHLSTARCRAAT